MPFVGGENGENNARECEECEGTMRGLRGNARGQRDLRSVFLRIAHWPCAVQFSTCDVRERSIPEPVQESAREKHGTQISLSPRFPIFPWPRLLPELRPVVRWQRTQRQRFGGFPRQRLSRV